MLPYLNRNFIATVLPLVLLIPLACRPSSVTKVAEFERRTLPNGAVELRYAGIRDDEARVLTPELRIGVGDGERAYMFGDVRGIDAAEDGTIYVLDFQAAEIRSYDSSGRYLGLIAAKGEGPAELNSANGLQLVGDSVIWVQDHGKRRVLRIDRNGVEIPTAAPPVTSYGYIWTGTVDETGWLWKRYSEQTSSPTYPPKDGLQVEAANLFMTGYDTKTAESDTVALGQIQYRSFVSSFSGGYSFSGIPFDPTTITIVDPAGGFWQANSHAYQVARLDSDGDTVLVVTVPVEPEAVSAADRLDYVNQVAERSPDRRANAESIAALIGDHKPVIANLVFDDVGRLWVRRSTDEGQPALYDIFGRDGLYVESVLLNPAPAPYLRIRIRDGKIYSLVSDSLGFPSVARTTKPAT